MAQLKTPNQLARVRDTTNGNDTGNGLKDPNPADFKPKQSVKGPGAAVKTPYDEEQTDEIMEPRIQVKGTGKEEARINKPYATLDHALKTGKTDF